MPEERERLVSADSEGAHTSRLRNVGILLVAVFLSVGILLTFVPSSILRPYRTFLEDEIARLLGVSRTQEESVLLKLTRSSDIVISRSAENLRSRFCNQPQVMNLMNALNSGHDYVSITIIGNWFIEKCDADVTIAYLTAQAHYRLTEYDEALGLMDRFAEDGEDAPDYLSWYGFVLEKLGRYEDAAEKFERSTYFFGDMKDVGGGQFYHVVRNLRAAGRYCDAIAPIRLYVSFDPPQRDTAQTRKIIEDLTAEGHCARDEKPVNAAIQLRKSGGVFIVTATINGRSGNFILDTGASIVLLERAFADRARIPLDNRKKITLSGITGARTDFLSMADIVEVGGFEAKNVQVAVSTDRGRMNDGIDGLLGQTFLSRFGLFLKDSSLTIQE